MHECIGNEYCDRSGCASYIYNASNRAKRANESALSSRVLNENLRIFVNFPSENSGGIGAQLRIGEIFPALVDPFNEAVTSVRQEKSGEIVFIRGISRAAQV